MSGRAWSRIIIGAVVGCASMVGLATSGDEDRVTAAPLDDLAEVAAFRSVRLLDERDADGAVRSGRVVRVEIGSEGIPMDSTGLFVTVTTTDGNEPGFVTLWDCVSARPTSSVINFAAKQTISAGAYTGTADGSFCAFVRGDAKLILDATAATLDGVGVRPVTPARLHDSRTNDTGTADGMSAGTGRHGAGKIVGVPVAGRVDLPGDVDSVFVTLTMTEPDADGYLTVFPCDRSVPTASNLNYRAGETIANAALVGLGSAGSLCVYSRAAGHVLVDVTGFVGAGGDPTAVEPTRLMDTRTWFPDRIVLGPDTFRQIASTADSRYAGRFTLDCCHGPVGQPVPDNQLVVLDVTARGGPIHAHSAVLNVVAIGQEHHGYVRVVPCNAPSPTDSTSIVNFGPGEVRSALTVAQVGSDGNVCLRVKSDVHLVVDALGFDARSVGATDIDGSIGSGNYFDTWCWTTDAGRLDCDGNTPHDAGNLDAFPTDFRAVDVEVGDRHGCARDEIGSIACWGDLQGDRRSTPIDIDLPRPATAISIGHYFTCALLDDTSVWCWGTNYNGQLGNGTTETNAVPGMVPGLDEVTAIASEYSSTCALRSDASVWCWGTNVYEPDTDGDNFFWTVPHEISAFDGATALTGSCVVRLDDAATCTAASFPYEVADVDAWSNMADIASGPCAVDSLQQLTCLDTTHIVDQVVVLGDSRTIVRADGSVWRLLPDRDIGGVVVVD